jgi:polyisoprenoid-binding protein YceI
MSTAITHQDTIEDWAGSHWRLERAESVAEFRVKHFWGLITVVGHFDRFDGTLDVDADGTPHIVLTIDADSLDTGNAKARPPPSLCRLFRLSQSTRWCSSTRVP